MNKVVETAKMMAKKLTNGLNNTFSAVDMDVDNSVFFNGEMDDDYSLDFDKDDLVDMYHWVVACDKKPSLMFC